MRNIVLTLLFTCLFVIGAQALTTTPTPTPATTPGNVSRVTYFDVLPGKGNEYTIHL